MKVNPTIQEIVEQKVLAGEEDRGMSGRLTASKLGWPIQWKILNYLKIPITKPDEYTLRKFQRGRDVEDRVVEWVNPSQKQVEVEYRGVTGRCDMVLDVPVEVKSVSNAAFKYLQKGGPKRGHIAQGMLYAKALFHDKFWVSYVASDDYRILTFEEPTTSLVDDEIDEYLEAINQYQTKGIVPFFEEKEPWHSKKEYNPYPEWQNLTNEEITKKIKAYVNATN